MKQKVIAYILIAIVILGFVYTVIETPWLLITPIVVLGGIFLLYKYPPAFLQKYARTTTAQSKHKSSYSTASNKSKVKRDRPRSKTVPFKVIEGGKDDNDTPRYH